MEKLIMDGDVVKNINIKDIEKILPHRSPFLLVDRVLEVIKHQSAVGIKNVTMNEPFFLGHFPEEPIMPGVLMVEALAQLGGIMALISIDNPLTKTKEELAINKTMVYLVAIDSVKFRKMVVPGDCLTLKVKKIQGKGMVWKMAGEALVDGDLCVEAVFTAMGAKSNQE